MYSKRYSHPSKRWFSLVELKIVFFDSSLPPRTRQTVRTAVIALVSALALVAIFHLAKLAEHPVAQKESTGKHDFVCGQFTVMKLIFFLFAEGLNKL